LLQCISPELLGLPKDDHLQARIVVLEGGFWHAQTRNKKKSEGAKSGEWNGYSAIRKKLSSQNAVVTFAGCGLALPACASFHFSLPAEQRSW
jgi:hypothetical protein